MSDEAFTKEIVGGVTESYSWLPFILAIAFLNTVLVLMLDLLVVGVYGQKSMKDTKSPRFWMLVGSAILAPLTIAFVSPFSSMIAFALFLVIQGFFVKLTWDIVQGAKHASEGKEKSENGQEMTAMKPQSETMEQGAENDKKMKK